MRTCLPDHGLPRSTVRCLIDQGLESVHVGERRMARSKDADILDFALHNDSIIVTLDSDFHTLLASRQSQRPTVIQIRVEGLQGPEMAQLLSRVIDFAREDVLAGSAISVG